MLSIMLVVYTDRNHLYHLYLYYYLLYCFHICVLKLIHDVHISRFVFVYCNFNDGCGMLNNPPSGIWYHLAP